MKNNHSAAIIMLVALILAVSGVSHAQYCDTIVNHQAGEYYLSPEYLVQLDDGSLLCRTFIDLPFPSNNCPTTPYGCIYYKISRHGAQITDTLFVEDNNIAPKLVAHLHPDSAATPNHSNVLVEYLFDTTNCKTDLRIAFFDDDLNFTDDEIIVPLADTFVQRNFNESSFLLDRHNDIVTEYGIWSRHESHFARFGLDGTLKYEKVYPDSIVPLWNDLNNGWVPRGLRQTGESPVRYSFFGQYEFLGFKCFELDSLFNIEEVFCLPPPNSAYPRMFTPRGLCGMVSLGEEGRVVMREYQENVHVCSQIGVAKYDREGNLLKTWFTGFHGTEVSGWGNYYAGIDLKKDSEGYIYFTAYTPYPVYKYDICFIAKLDKDLNAVYERYYMHPELGLEVKGMNILDNGGMCVFGDMWEKGSSPWESRSGLFMLVLDDDGVPVSETEGIIQPFLFYPNPVSDRLNIHYSPDVTPKAVELYDLQGRLIKTQDSNLESIGMENLPAGNYTLRVVMEGGENYTEKVVKQ